MAIVAKERAKEFRPAPEGLHQAVCVDVVALGLVETQFGKKEMVKLVWQIGEMDEESKPPKPFQVSRRYGLTLDKRSTLRKDLETWRAKKFSKEELEGFDLEKLLGVNCQLQVVHNVTDDGGTYANVQAIVPAAKGATKMAPVFYTREKDRTDKPQSQVPAEQKEDDDEVPF